MTSFFQKQIQQCPHLRKKIFLNLMHRADDVNVLLITELREKAPIAALSHLVPKSKLLEIHVCASAQTRRARRESHGPDENENDDNKKHKKDNGSNATTLNYCPSYAAEWAGLTKHPALGCFQLVMAPFQQLLRIDPFSF